jgi:hypothetical protein
MRIYTVVTLEEGLLKYLSTHLQAMDAEEAFRSEFRRLDLSPPLWWDPFARLAVGHRYAMMESGNEVVCFCTEV